MENAPEFYESFQRAALEEHGEIVLDFSRIRFVDSSGVGMLLKCAHGAANQQSRLLFYGLNRSLHSVFRLAGLLRIFKLLEEEEARSGYPELFR